MKKNIIKDSFKKVKEDILTLKLEIRGLRQTIFELTNQLNNLSDNLSKTKKNKKNYENTPLFHVDTSFDTSTQNPNFATFSTKTSTQNSTQEPLKHQNLPFSTGNEGVSTDRQTDKQTDRQTQNKYNLIISELKSIYEQKNEQNNTENIKNKEFFQQTPPADKQESQQKYKKYDYNKQETIKENIQENMQNKQEKNPKNTQNPVIIDDEQQDKQPNSLKNAEKILESIDHLKDEIKAKFKALTPQEMIVFSHIYQLDEQGTEVDYKTLSNKLNLTQSSIRDHVTRVINKGIPVDKYKLKNKKIILKISPNLKKIATLDTILKIREN